MSNSAGMQHVNEEAMGLLNEMELCEGAISPAYGSTAKAIIMLWGTKLGFGLGARIGRGYMLVKLPHRAGEHEEESGYRWSAPIFVKVRVVEAGLCFGYARSRSFILAMSDRVQHQLANKGHPMFGVDTTFTLFNTSGEDKSDVIALASGDSDLVVASVVNGAMLDFSFAGGTMSVDETRMNEMYGSGVSVHSVMNGEITPPFELKQLYGRINSMILGVRAPPPSLTRTSLQRYTAGYDPDRRIVSSKSARVIQRGNSEEILADSTRVQATREP